MNLASYLEKRRQTVETASISDPVCKQCLLTTRFCYCGGIKKFYPEMDFVILIHPIEVRRRIATGRMSHLTLENSVLIRGHDFSKNAVLNEIISDSSRECVVLYPGTQSTNLSDLTEEKRSALFDSQKKLTIIVVDGTWMTARKMMHLSQNINKLPRISFTPNGPSNFKVRKQPRSFCLSTIEAIHTTIELLGPMREFNLSTRKHDALLDVFDSMVEKRLRLLRESHNVLGPNRYRRHKKKCA